jgi:5-methylcytosine-specific restriction endonuclease McrA
MVERKCNHCGAEDCILDLDHKTPVKFSGGGKWLDNYQYLCKKCHRIKTNSDFGWKKQAV